MLPLLQTTASATQSTSTMWYPTFLRFLISWEFYSKLGFLISYTVTSLLVLEVLRLVYTDANKREVEKLIDSYTGAKTSPRPERKTRRIPLDELEKRPKTSSRRKSMSPAMSPDSERTLVGEEERRRRKRAQSLVTLVQPLSQTQAVAQTTVPAPSTRRLRKRSDTVISSGSSSESRKLERERRRRSASPASLASSKASSRGGSPKPRKVRERDALQMSAMMSKVLRQKV